MSSLSTALNEPVISGPFSLYEGSFILEFLKPDPSRNASVLMRCTYKHDHHLCRKGKGHPQSPPLHLHFNQSESFTVLSGSVGTTHTWSATDHIWTPADGIVTIEPWKPHTFWADGNATEDTTILLWAHPDGTEDDMDRAFFHNILFYVSDLHEGKAKMDPFQLMLMQHATATAMVWFPRAWFLGPIRWWLPYQIQTAFAGVARLMGKESLIRKYTSDDDWKKLQEAKKAK
ncbi:MAG: hypothetical protein M1818_004897 [Claussenomyces sp. TS43310]|nr:MAG: hypothetical protein M1818_004897 [Claussenomyces sp. TS43310]